MANLEDTHQSHSYSLHPSSSNTKQSSVPDRPFLSGHRNIDTTQIIETLSGTSDEDEDEEEEEDDDDDEDDDDEEDEDNDQETKKTKKTTKDVDMELDNMKLPEAEKPSPSAYESDMTLFQYSKVLQLEHAMTNFIDGLRKIIALSPNLHVFNDILENQYDKIPVETLPALARYKLKLGSELVSLHELGKLDLFDDILNYADSFNKQTSSSEPLIFKKTDYEKLVELDNLKNIAKRQALKKNKNGLSSSTSSVSLNKFKSLNVDQGDDSYEPKLTDDEDSEGGKPSKAKKGSQNNTPVWPPKLPQIKDPAIKARVFIHKSMINDKLYLTETDMLNAHNERLEFLGDAILNTTVTMMLYNKFPSFNEGHLSQLRMKLINNEKLKEWSFLYDFQDKLKANLDSKTRLENGQTYFQQGKQKLYSDVFEAYIGGLIEDNPKKNLPKVRKWLEKLSAPIINDHLKSNSLIAEDDVDVNAKKTLYSLIGYAALNLHYVTVRRPSTGNPYAEVECRIKDELVLGSGMGKNVKIAGMKAAQNVLSKKELVEKYANMRAAIPREESMAKPEHPSRASQLSINNDNYNPHEFGHSLTTSISPKHRMSTQANGASQTSPNSSGFPPRSNSNRGYNNRGGHGSGNYSQTYNYNNNNSNNNNSNNNDNNNGGSKNNHDTANKRIKISKNGTFVFE